jgi:hypothetical protein
MAGIGLPYFKKGIQPYNPVFFAMVTLKNFLRLALLGLMLHSSTSCLRAQLTDFRHATLETPVSPRVKSLALQTTTGCKTEFEKVYAIHEWITHHISYSYAVSGSHYTGTDQVILGRKAVCQGYADLFAALCIASKVEARVVHGYGKTKTSDIGEATDSTNHAWNIVKIEGREYLVDACWDAGYYGNGKFTSDPRTSFFLSNPAVFALSHFPEHPEDQLLERPLTAKQFFGIPHVNSNIFAFSLRLMKYLPGSLKPGSTVKADLLVETACSFWVAFGDKDLQPLEALPNGSGQLVSLQFEVPNDFKGTARLYVSRPEEGLRHSVMEFVVN